MLLRVPTLRVQAGAAVFFAALQSPALPFAHNFRLVSLATRVSAHEEQPTSPDESFCKFSHDHWEGERGRRRGGGIFV